VLEQGTGEDKCVLGFVRNERDKLWILESATVSTRTRFALVQHLIFNSVSAKCSCTRWISSLLFLFVITITGHLIHTAMFTQWEQEMM